MRTDRIFIYDSDIDRTLYGTGRFQDAISGESDRAYHKHDPGSVLILGPGPFPKLGVIGAAIATVMAQAIVMSIMVLAIIVRKKRKCTEGYKTFGKDPGKNI